MSALSSPPSRLFEDVRSILREAHSKAYVAANAAMVDAYWRIGQLAGVLGKELGRGISVANLRNSRQFYLTFPDAEKPSALRSALGWSHWRPVMQETFSWVVPQRANPMHSP